MVFGAGNAGTHPGSRLSVHRLIASLMSALPHRRTNTTSRRYGDQAIISSPAEWRFMSTAIGLSPSRRMMVFGFQNVITSTITTMQVSELRMSVSSGPM